VRKQGCKKEVFPAALREKSPHWVALSYDAHLLFARQGKIRQPCTVSLSDSVSCEQFFYRSAFLRGKLHSTTTLYFSKLIQFFRDLNGLDFEAQDENSIERKSSTKRKEDDNTFSQKSSNTSSVVVFPGHKRQKIADSEHI